MTTYSFTEQGPLEAGFAAIFHERIVPILERHEAERQELRSKAIRGMSISGLGGASGAGIGFTNEYEVAGGVAGVVGGMGVFGVRSLYESRWKAGLGAEIVPILCDFLGGMRPGGHMVSASEFARLGVVPTHHSSHTEDPVQGEHNGIAWALTEAKLTSRSRDSKGRRRNKTVFRGLLFQIAVDRPAPRIYFARDRGGVINWLSETMSGARRGLEKIEASDPEFEKIYEVYTDDPAAAREYVDPNVLEGLLLISKYARGGGYVAAAFEGDWFRLALPRRRDFLSLGSLFRPTSEIEADLHNALSDLDLPRRIIDALSGR
ncbi:MAG: DUF3137 domain-containing protein [Pseudomonadota bacterium]